MAKQYQMRVGEGEAVYPCGPWAGHIQYTACGTILIAAINSRAGTLVFPLSGRPFRW